MTSIEPTITAKHFARQILIACLLILTSSVGLAVDYEIAEIATLPSAKSLRVIEISEPDVTGLIEEDLTKPRSAPLRYAAFVTAKASLVEENDWNFEQDEAVQYVSIQGRSAKSLELIFSEFWLPHGATLSFFDPNEPRERLVYSDSDNPKANSTRLHSTIFPRSNMIVEVRVPRALTSQVKLQLEEVGYGYRAFGGPQPKSLSCNVDVACPEGDAVRNEIRATTFLRYRFGFSGYLCTGQMINNVNADRSPYLLTSNHCRLDLAAPENITVYFNYESRECRIPGSTASGRSLSLSSFTDLITGGRVVSRNQQSDFALLLLDDPPPNQFDAYYVGWDNRDIAPSMATAIHHPGGNEKRVSVEFDPVVEGDTDVELGSDFGGEEFTLLAGTYWQVLEWDVGITELGSSGGAMYNQNNHLVGQLSGGALFRCPGAEEGPDLFGKFSLSWDFGDSPTSRLRDWLDPNNTGAQTLNGITACNKPQVSISSNTNPAVIGQDVTFSTQISGGIAPYTVSWDFNDDGLEDSESDSITVRFARADSRTVRVTVTDSDGCIGEDSFGQVITAPTLEITGVSNPVQQCGNNDNDLDPGETWSFPIAVTNTSDNLATDITTAFALETLEGGTIVDDVDIHQGAVAIDQLNPNQTEIINIDLTIGAEFACGDVFSLDYLGAGHSGGYSDTRFADVFSVEVGAEQCDAVVACSDVVAPAALNFTEGFYFNPERPGNGMDLHLADNRLYSAWYTALQQGEPTWYYLQTLTDAFEYGAGSQVRGTILRFLSDGPFGDRALTATPVGSVIFSFVEPGKALMTWELEGETFGEMVQFLAFAATPPDGQITDQYFNPNESGWGLGLQRQGNDEFVAVYFYGEQGNPRWVVSVSPDLLGTGQSAMSAFRVHCPGCDWIEGTETPAGILSRTFNMDGSAVLDLEIDIEGEYPVEWFRSDLPISPIAPPTGQ